MAKILSLLLIVVMVLGLIPTGLVLASQNAVPGDGTYPVKRMMEGVIINLASLHPATRTYFRVDLASRRFDESAKLLARGKGELVDESLVEFSEATKSTVEEILKTQDVNTRRELAKKMLAQLQSQKQRIAEVTTSTNLAQAQPNAPPTPTPTPVLVQTQVTNNFGQVRIIVVTATPTPRPPTPTPTPTPRPSPGSPAAPANPGGAIDEGIKALVPIAADPGADARTALPTSTPTPKVIKINTPTPRFSREVPGATARTTGCPTDDPDCAEFELVGDELPTPTPIPQATPTPPFTYPGCPEGTYSAQCMSESEKASYQNGTNSICYNYTGTPLAYICLESCGSCTP